MIHTVMLGASHATDPIIAIIRIRSFNRLIPIMGITPIEDTQRRTRECHAKNVTRAVLEEEMLEILRKIAKLASLAGRQGFEPR